MQQQQQLFGGWTPPGPAGDLTTPPPQILYLDLTVGLPGNGGNRDKREVKEGMRSSNVSKVK